MTNTVPLDLLVEAALEMEEVVNRPRQLSLRKKDFRTDDDMLVPVEGAKSLETMTRKACKKTSERGVETRNESKSDDGLGNQVEEEETRSKTAKVSRPLMGGTLEERNRLSDRGILLISHLPPGFLEPQLKRFFTQFGQIKRLRLIRSKKVRADIQSVH